MKRILLILLIASSCWGQWQGWKQYPKTPGYASDSTAPPPVTLSWDAVTFVATGVNYDSLRLQATTGYSTYVDSIRLLIRAGSYPTATVGTLIFAGDTTGWSKDTTVYISGLSSATLYYARLYQQDSLLAWKSSSDTGLVPIAPDTTPPDSADNFAVTSTTKETVRIQASAFPTDVDSGFIVRSPSTITTLTGLDTLFSFAGADTGLVADSTFAFPVDSDTTLNFVMQLQDALGNEQDQTEWNKETGVTIDSLVIPDTTPPDSATVFIVTSTTKETVRIRANTFPTDVDSGFIVRSPTAISTLSGLDTLFKFAAADTGDIADSTFAFPVDSDTLLNWVMQLQDDVPNKQNSTQWNKEAEVAIDSLGASGGGSSWPSEITLFQTFENGADVDSGNGDFSISGDITATTTGTPSITGTDEIFGDSAAAITAASTYFIYDLSGGTFLTADHGKIGFSLRVDAIANTNTVVNIYESGTSSGPDNRFSVTMATGGDLGMEWDQDPTGTAVVETSGGTISPGDTVFVVAWFDQSDGRRKLVIYDMDKTGLDSVDSDAALDAMSGWGSMQVGTVSPSGTPDIVVDNIIIATDTTTNVLQYLDSLTYGGGGGGGGADTTPPDSASSFIVSSPDKDSVNVAVSGYATDATNVIINYKTGSYPTSRTDGTTQFNFAIADSANYQDTTFFYDAADDNTILYFSGWHRDAAANWSTTALRNKDTVSVDSTGGAVIDPGPEGSSLFIIAGLSGATKSTTVNGNSLTTQAVENTAYYFKSDSTGSYITQ